MIHLLLADGFEEIEALATLDILRRCGLLVTTISINGTRLVEGAHGIPVMADNVFRQAKLAESEAIILPGGMPGAKNLLDSEGLRKTLLAFNERGGLIAAICAAPMVLGQHGLLQGRNATCYPGFEDKLTGATHCSEYVVEDGNIITGKGPAAAVEFACAIASRFVTAERVAEVKQAMLYQ